MTQWKFWKKLAKKGRQNNYLFRGKKLGRGSAVLYGIEYALNNFDDIDLFIEMDVDMFTIQRVKKSFLFFVKIILIDFK